MNRNKAPVPRQGDVQEAGALSCWSARWGRVQGNERWWVRKQDKVLAGSPKALNAELRLSSGHK